VPIFLVAVFVLQVLLIVPHELGHAFFARAFNFPDIRIFIGFGRPLMIFRLFGFQWAVNSVPAGGRVYTSTLDSAISWRSICFVSGGLMVNLFMVLLCLLLLPRGFLTDGEWTWLEALLYANVVIIVVNLTPYTMSTPEGTFHTDGRMLWRLFRGNFPQGIGHDPSLRSRKTSAVLKGPYTKPDNETSLFSSSRLDQPNPVLTWGHTF